MDISEVWPLLRILLVPVAAVTVIRVAKRVPRRWLRILIRTLSSSVLAISAMLVFLLLLAEVSCIKHPPAIHSPDSRHSAILTYQLKGVFDNDSAFVRVRRSWIPFADEAYAGVGVWDYKHNRPSMPEVRWLDSSHLLIRYRDERGVCLNRASDVEIICENGADAAKSGIGAEP